MIDLGRLLGRAMGGAKRGTRGWSIRLALLVATALLLVALNPEVRILLLLVDAIGIDVLLLMIAAQFGGWWSLAASASMFVLDRGMRLARRLGRVAAWWGLLIVPREGVWIAAGALATAIGSLFVVGDR